MLLLSKLQIQNTFNSIFGAIKKLCMIIIDYLTVNSTQIVQMKSFQKTKSSITNSLFMYQDEHENEREDEQVGYGY